MERSTPPRRRDTPSGVAFGKYRLGRRIAVGGMAEIFLARPEIDGPDAPNVVIKRILPQLAEDPTFVEMFIDEARIVAHLSHPNVVQVFDFGEVDGHYYLAMEHVDGLDAWRLIRRFARAGTTIPPELAAHVCMEVLSGLEYVHAATDQDGVPLGIVHSDVSPSNVYVSKKGDVKIGDFGIARARLRRDRTDASSLTGKYGYMAPEQVLGRSFDHRADLFAVGVVLAELLTGQPLFTGSSKLTVLLAVRDVRIEPLRQRSAELPPGLMRVLLRALSRDPARRYLDAREFRAALAAVVAESGPAPDAATLGAAVRGALSVREPVSAPGIEAVRSESGRLLRDDETPLRTPTEPEGRYVFLESDGVSSDPMNFASAVERVVTGQVGPDTQVSVESAAFVPVVDVPELSRHLPAYVAAGDIVRTPPAETTGDVEQTSVVAILGQLVLGRASGLVLFEWEPARKEVYLVDGRPEFVTSNLAGELLGEFLVTRKVLTRGELDMALAVLPRFEGHLGETLVALGLVDAVKVVRHIADQVKGKLLELFHWRRGKYTFYRGAEPPRTGFPLGLDAVEILCEGVRCGYPLAELQDWIEARRATSIVLHAGSALPSSLPPVHRRVYESVAKPTLLGELPMLHAGADRVEVLRAIVLGVEAGVLVRA